MAGAGKLLNKTLPSRERNEESCGQSRRVVAAEDIVEPVVAPIPPAATPAEATHVQIAIGAAVNRAPEEHVFAFPLLGDQLGVGKQVVQQIGIDDRLVLELSAELVALNALAVFLTGGEVELDELFRPLDLPGLLVLLDLPAIGHERIGVAVNQVLCGLDLGMAEQHAADLREHVALAESLDFLVGPVSATKRCLQLTSLINVERKVAHS